MASLEEIRGQRLEKLEALRRSGRDPYPPRILRDRTIAELRGSFDALSKSGNTVSIGGRVMAIRGQGAIRFAVLFDGTDRFQAVLKRDDMSEDEFTSFELFVDIGDVISVTGTCFATDRGEASVLVSSWVMGAKSLRPLPEKHVGLRDPEEKLRLRYLDLLTDPTLRELFHKKALFWQAIRTFMVREGFLEVETPVIERTTGGADARPFATHHHALDLDVYLRISAGELWQKRLMVAGFPKVFEIGRIFRNEGISPEHAQDYTQIEFYWAFAAQEDGMALVKRLYREAAQAAFGTLRFTIGKFDVDLGAEWETYDYGATIARLTGVNIATATISEIESVLRKLKVEYDPKGWNRIRAIDTLWKYCRKQLGGPGFLVGIPKEMSPLAKSDPADPTIVLQFQPIIAGSEVGKGYSELNDPIDQGERFAAQQAMRDAGDEEAQMADLEFVEALEYGMPPTCGFGVSERLFAFLANRPIRETQLFPLLRPRG
jgi:lysyl-tRNA synthetase class 2